MLMSMFLHHLLMRHRCYSHRHACTPASLLQPDRSHTQPEYEYGGCRDYGGRGKEETWRLQEGVESANVNSFLSLKSCLRVPDFVKSDLANVYLSSCEVVETIDLENSLQSWGHHF